ncbi:MAG TPA: alkaline phosphatase [Melioribacteraceae bacterium]|nr:alkaline phosphatase [Melioribacteraceae bacterium]
MKLLKLFMILILPGLSIISGQNSSSQSLNTEKGNVIFIHPDGTSLAVWNAVRLLYAGPDSQLNWDKLLNVGIYLGHMTNSLTATSNGGGTIHAYGVKVGVGAYGTDDKLEKPVSRSGKRLSIMQEAMGADIRTGLINSGSIIEPGTGAFVVTVPSRKEDEEIAKQTIFSGVDVIMYGGEEWLLPKGTSGFHTKSGKRTDGLNLIEEAKNLGYKVIYSREQLLNLPKETEKLLGIFSEDHTFNDKPEEEQNKLGLQNFKPGVPTLAEMTEAAIQILSRNNQQFLLVVEEEGTDNFGNKNNARGTLEALKRADDALGVALKYIDSNPKTLLITCSDSEAGGMEAISYTEDYFPFDKPISKLAPNGAPYDGVDGPESFPFRSKPDKLGRTFPFVISWSTTDDVCGSVLVRAAGLNSEYVKGSVDNTDIYKFMYLTLFGKMLP